MVKEKDLVAGGSFNTEELDCGGTYKVSFLLKMTQDSTTKGNMVNLQLCLPGIVQTKQAHLPTSTGKWEELEVGRFEMTEQNVGTMIFDMEQSFEHPKKGLIIKEVKIKLE